MAELGRGVDPFEVDLLEGTARGVGEHGLAESHDTLLDTGDGTLEHDKVVVDRAITNEATHAERELVMRGTWMNDFFGITKKRY